MRNSRFNMIEVLLAIGVIAIGVVSVLALVPYGLNANRDAAAETYAANAAQHLLHSLKYVVEQPGTNWATYITADTKIGSTSPDVSAVGVPTLSGLGAFGSAGTIHEDPTPPGRLGVYHVVSFLDANNNNTLDAGERIDFRCIVGVWKSDIMVDASTPILRTVGVTLTVEVQWPAELPAAARRKRVYTLELFNPNA